MKRVNSLIVSILVVLISSSLYAGATIGTVYGKHKYKAYIGTGNGIYLQNKSTGKVCDTRLISKKNMSLPQVEKLYITKMKFLQRLEEDFI